MTQLTRADLAGMTHGQINAARAEGRLTVLLGGAEPLEIDAGHVVSLEDVKRLTTERRYAELHALRRDGRLDHLLIGDPADHA